jgi:signal transduction histidine kinase
MRWSIRYQLLVPLLTLLLGVLGMSTWAALASAGRARHQIETQVRDIGRTLNESAFPLKERVLHLMKGFSGADFLVVDRDGGRLTTLETADVALPAPEAEADDWQALTLGSRVTVGETAYLASGVRLRQGPNAGATLYVFYPESLWRDAVWEAVRPALVLGVCGGAAAVVLAVAVAQRLSRRVQELERRTRLIAAGDFSPMPLPRRKDELRDLTQSVNEMAQRLAQYQETVQRSERLRLLGQVGGGLAHQLRNGLTGARLAVQLHARECPAQGDGESLAVALRQLTLLEMHLKRFLDLGRAADLRREPVSLAAVLQQTVALLGPQCRHAHIDLRWQLPGGPEAAAGWPTVLGDAGQLGQLFLNVAGNAVEAAGPGGSVEVRLGEPDAGRVTVEVTDSGPGPAEEVAGRLFEPFVTAKKDGVGLGLAVARQVAEAHGGRISWRREQGRTCFAIELPSESGR